jgi:serine/threonine protein kinase
VRVCKKTPEETKKESQARERLKSREEYKGVEFSGNCIIMPKYQIFALDSVSACKQALSALRHLHVAGVIHGDISPPHVRACDGKVVFIDFGCSGFQPLEESIGVTRSFASVDRLVYNDLHPLDDYEGLLLLFAREIGFCQPKQLEEFSIKVCLRHFAFLALKMCVVKICVFV